MANETIDGASVNRRGFLTVGGMTLGLSALAAACVNAKTTEQIPQTGTRVPAPSTSVAPDPGSKVLDATLLLTVLSVERLAIETYDQILKNGWLSTAGLNDLLRKVQERHRQHADLVAAQASSPDYGQDVAGVKANDAVRKALVKDEIDAIQAVAGDKAKTETETLKLVLAMEDTVAQLYAKAVGTLTTPSLRQTAASIGAISAKQYSVVASVSSQPPVPFAFEHAAPGAAPEDSYQRADESKVRTRGTGTTVGR